MKPTAKTLVKVTLASSLVGVLIMSSCKTISTKSADSYVKVDEAKLESGIQSYNALARQLEANKTSLKGCDKLDMIWKNINLHQQKIDALVPPKTDFGDVLTFGNGSAQRFWKIFSGWTADDWGGKFAGNDIRPYIEAKLKNTMRLTHRFGIYAKLAYIPIDNSDQYTGQYATGNNCILGRLSSAVPTTVEERFTPALSAKFFLDGAKESQVLIAQHDIGGQSSGQDAEGRAIPTTIDNNFYSKYLSNRLSFENFVPNGFGAASRFFYAAEIIFPDKAFDPRELASRHLAAFSNDGKSVANAKGPRFIWLAPPKGMKAMFKAKAEETLDFRKHFMSMTASDYTETHDGKPVLFNVFAGDQWTYEPEFPEKDASNFARGAKPKLIGKFVLMDNSILASDAADVRLFFKHSFAYSKLLPPEENDKIYHQDYPASQWSDELFTSKCALGAKKKELYPTKDNPMEGTFLRSAIVTDARFDGPTYCFAQFMYDKLKPVAQEKFSEAVDAIKEKVGPMFRNL